MGKEKVKREEKKTHDVYYEVIGLILIFSSSLIIAQAGRIGLGIRIIFKVIFGDFYFLIILMMFVSGFIVIFQRNKFNPFSLRYLGLALLVLSLMVLNHSSIYSFCFKYGNNEIAGAWNLYIKYLNGYRNEYIFGGGLLGAFIYQLLHSLFGASGAYLICLLGIILAVIFITNNNIFSFYSYLKEKYICLMGLCKRLIAFIKEKNKPKRPQHKGYNTLSDTSSNINMEIQKKLVEDYTLAITNFFKNSEYKILDITGGVSYLFSQIDIKLANYDIKGFKEMLRKILKTNFYFYQNQGVISIEFENRFKDLLTLKKLLSYNNKGIIGLDFYNNPIVFDYNIHKHMLVCGANDSGIRSFIRSVITMLYLSEKIFTLYIADLNNDFWELSKNRYCKKIEEMDSLLTEIFDVIEQRLAIINYLHVNCFTEANKKIRNEGIECETIKPLIFLINGLEQIYDVNYFQKLEGKLVYIAELGAKAGVILIAVCRDASSISSVFKGALPLKLVFKVKNMNQSLDLLDNDHALFLVGRGDFIYRFNDVEKRCQSGFVITDEYNEIIKR